MSVPRILIVEDDEAIMELLASALARENCSIAKAVSGEEALRKITGNPPDMILLDLMLPEIDGLEVCRRLKANEKTRGVSIVMVTARGDESDVVAGLELGAEDYVVKPFRVRELVARVRTVLRRKSNPSRPATQITAAGGLEIDEKRHEVKVNGNSVDLTATEFRILLVLAGHPGWVFTRNQIVDAVRGTDYAVTDRAVDVQIVGLRKKLGKAGLCVETVRGVGYRFKDDQA